MFGGSGFERKVRRRLRLSVSPSSCFGRLAQARLARQHASASAPRPRRSGARHALLRIPRGPLQKCARTMRPQSGPSQRALSPTKKKKRGKEGEGGGNKGEDPASGHTRTGRRDSRDGSPPRPSAREPPSQAHRMSSGGLRRHGRDLYRLLRVPRTATRSEIKESYRRIALVHDTADARRRRPSSSSSGRPTACCPTTAAARAEYDRWLDEVTLGEDGRVRRKGDEPGRRAEPVLSEGLLARRPAGDEDLRPAEALR